MFFNCIAATVAAIICYYCYAILFVYSYCKFQDIHQIYAEMSDLNIDFIFRGDPERCVRALSAVWFIFLR